MIFFRPPWSYYLHAFNWRASSSSIHLHNITPAGSEALHSHKWLWETAHQHWTEFNTLMTDKSTLLHLLFCKATPGFTNLWTSCEKLSLAQLLLITSAYPAGIQWIIMQGRQAKLADPKIYPTGSEPLWNQSWVFTMTQESRSYAVW